jgi:peptide/nickel transport system substrate-binding protein
MVMFASGLEMTESPRNGYTTSGIPTEANGYGGSNYSGISIPRFDELTDQAEKEFDPEKQKLLWAEMQKIYATQLPQVPIYFRADAHVVPKWLKGYTPSGIGDATSNWSQNWRAE